MTFVETFTVIVILGVLMGGITILARHSRYAANTARAKADMVQLSGVIDRYASIFGEIPSGEDLSATAQSKDKGFDDDSFAITNLWNLGEVSLPYAENAIGGARNDKTWNWRENLTNTASNVDPWGHPYRYRPLRRDSGRGGDIPGWRLVDEASFEIYSCGPRLKWNDCLYTNDDIRILP